MNTKSKSFFFSSVVILQGSVLMLNVLLRGFQSESIITFLLSAVISTFIFYLCMDDDVYTLSYSKLGESAGKIVSIIYVLYFVLAAAYNINLLASFINEYVLEKTPKAFFIIVFTSLCAYGAHKGHENLLRLSVVFFAVAVISEIINIVMLSGKIQLYNFLPIFSAKPENYIKSLILSTVLIIGDMSIFLCFPQKDGKKKGLIWGTIIGSIILALTVFKSVAVLGNMTALFTWPTHETLRVINMGNVLARAETTAVFVMLTMIFFKISMLYCCAVKGIKKISKVRKRGIPVMLCRTTIFVTACLMFASGDAAMNVWGKYSPFIIIPFAFLVPLILKKLKRIKGVN